MKVKIKIGLRIFLVAVLLCLLWFFLKIFQMQILNDVSLEKPKNKEKTITYAISYADGDAIHFKNQNYWARSCINRGVDHIILYTKKHIDKNFYSKNKHILKQKKGAGYWLWKPYFILQTLRSMPEDAVLIYSDSGSFIDKDLDDLIFELKNGIMLFYGTRDNKPFIKKDCVVLMGKEKSWEELKKLTHIQATNLLIRNNKNTRKFVEEWLHFSEDERILTDSKSTVDGEFKEFVSHRHDQSILNVLCYKNPLCQVRKNDLEPVYFAQHRRRTNNRYLSLAGLEKANRRELGKFFTNDIYNSWLLQTIRKKILE
jgi:hypothetical protein